MFDSSSKYQSYPWLTQYDGGLLRQRYRLITREKFVFEWCVFADVLDTQNQRPGTVQMLLQSRSSPPDAQCIINAAHLLSHLDHPLLPTVHDFLEESDPFRYLILDRLDGLLLPDAQRKQGIIQGRHFARGVPQSTAIQWGIQLATVLDYLHGQQPPLLFAHLHPSAVLITPQNTARLFDFSFAHTLDQSPPSFRTMARNSFLAPERLHGRRLPAGDIYALGATLYFALTRHNPARNKPFIYSFPPLLDLRPDLSEDLAQIIIRALEPRPEDRWSDAATMHEALLKLHSRRL